MIIKEYQKNILHKFIVEYYKYLSTWNKSASLTSMIMSTENLDPKSITDEIFEELISIAHFEYKDTKTMTSDPIMSIDDILKMINRNSKIESILK